MCCNVWRDKNLCGTNLCDWRLTIKINLTHKFVALWYLHIFQVSYVSSSSTFTTHPCPMERHQLVSSDVMILCGLTNAPSANPDTMLHEMCNRMGGYRQVTALVQLVWDITVKRHFLCMWPRVHNKEGGRVSYSLYPCVTAVVTVHDFLPYHLIQAVAFHTYTTSSKRSWTAVTV